MSFLKSKSSHARPPSPPYLLPCLLVIPKPYLVLRTSPLTTRSSYNSFPSLVSSFPRLSSSTKLSTYSKVLSPFSNPSQVVSYLLLSQSSAYLLIIKFHWQLIFIIDSEI